MARKCVLCDKPAIMVFAVRIESLDGEHPDCDEEDGWDMCEDHAREAYDSVVDTADNTFEPSDR